MDTLAVIHAINEYADFRQALGHGQLPERDKVFVALRALYTSAIEETDTWDVEDDTDSRNVRLIAPDGTRVVLSAHEYGGACATERLTVL